MSKKCIGCGILLQNDNKEELGYTPKIDSDYCQRCFRISKYNDNIIDMKQDLSNEIILKNIANIKDSLIVWVIDIFDFDANIIPDINKVLNTDNILVVCSKRDLLPEDINNEKISAFILNRLQYYKIKVKGVVVCGDLKKHAKSDFNYSIDELNHAFDILALNKRIVIMGMANAGKSTIINALLQNNVLTTSYYPGTTLDINELQYEDYTIYDTPGLTRFDSFMTFIDNNDIKSILPNVQVKPNVYQLRDNQSYAIGGLVRIDVVEPSDMSIVTYFNNNLQIHRSKLDNADKLWEDHYNELFTPVLEQLSDFKTHVFHEVNHQEFLIHGLGFFTVKGKCKKVVISLNKKVRITIREEII